MIYQLVNKRTEILAIATSHIAHLSNKHNHVFVLLISMPRFNSIKVYQNRREIELFCQKNTKSYNSEGFASRPPIVSRGWGLRPIFSTYNHA